MSQQTRLLKKKINLQTHAPFDEWINSIIALLKSVDNDFIQSYSISIVPEGLKESNKDHHHPAKKQEEYSSNKHQVVHDVYMPRVVSMGPRFKGTKEDLLLMEEVKLRCMLSLIHRAGKSGDVSTYLEKCCRVIWDLDGEIRASYVADINHIKIPDLAKIMLVDGCFLLELLISKGTMLNEQLPCRIKTPPLAPQVLLNEDVLSDLILFENQIPIFVLLDLFGTLFPHVFEEDLRDRAMAISINNLALSIFGYDQLPPDHQTSSAPHILDVVHFFVNTNKESKSKSTTDHDQIPPTNGNDQAVVLVDIPSSNPELRLKRCASRLRAYGVSIKVAKETKSKVSCFMANCFGGILLWLKNIFILILSIIIDSSRQQEKVPPRQEIEGIKGLDFDFNFDKGKLVIAQLHIKKSTKATWRNVIAWKHHHKKGGKKSSNGKFTAAALIFDGLICCTADVKLLKENNIIVDHTKMSNKELEEFFHTMSFGVDHGVVDSRYVTLISQLNDYSRAFIITRAWRVFWHLFRWCFQRLKKFMSKNYHFVLSFVTLLTVLSTVYTLVAYHHPAN